MSFLESDEYPMPYYVPGTFQGRKPKKRGHSKQNSLSEHPSLLELAHSARNRPLRSECL